MVVTAFVGANCSVGLGTPGRLFGVSKASIGNFENGARRIKVEPRQRREAQIRRRGSRTICFIKGRTVVEPADLHDQQVIFWNGPGGERWAKQQDMIDDVLAPVATLAIEAAAPRLGESVIDVGCGGGVTSRMLAGLVGAAGRVIGLDVSAPLLTLARRTPNPPANLEFRLADAASAPLEDLVADLVFSRFGVMFFGDPAAAFANLRRGMRPGGRLAFACWRAPRENPWMMVPLQAAYRHVPRLPELGPEDPGPFSFADAARVKRILDAAGFGDISVQPRNLVLDLAAGGGLEAAVGFATAVGAASRAIEDQPENTRRAATSAIREALAPFVAGGSVRLAGAIWLVAAVNPG
jgi:SAM-dependent methyltransferase